MELFNESPFNKLPKELIYIILSYTPQPQSKELTEDIRNFQESKQIILNVYHNYWINNYNEPEPSDKEWLINDLHIYFNRNSAAVYGYVDDFFSFFYRKFNILTKEKVYQCIIKLDNKSLDTQINFYWGLLNFKERNEFISIHNFV
jgi:hypothetical protein